MFLELGVDRNLFIFIGDVIFFGFKFNVLLFDFISGIIDYNCVFVIWVRYNKVYIFCFS